MDDKAALKVAGFFPTCVDHAEKLDLFLEISNLLSNHPRDSEVLQRAFVKPNVGAKRAERVSRAARELESALRELGGLLHSRLRAEYEEARDKLKEAEKYPPGPFPENLLLLSFVAGRMANEQQKRPVPRRKVQWGRRLLWEMSVEMFCARNGSPLDRGEPPERQWRHEELELCCRFVALILELAGESVPADPDTGLGERRQGRLRRCTKEIIKDLPAA